MKNKLKSNNGITVLSLIVTIILLLILAGVSLGTIFNSDGLLEQANDAASRYNQAKEDEDKYLASVMNEIDKYNKGNGGGTSGTPTPSGTTEPSITPDTTVTPTPIPEKQEGRLTLSSTSGTIIYPNDGLFTIQENTSNGRLSVSSSDDSVASASISGNTVTITPKEIGVSQKQVVITVKSAETSTHKEKTATYIATIKQGGITLEATVTTRQYNGTPFDAITSVSVTPTDAKVEYSLDSGAYQTAIPKITNAGEYTVVIRATKAGYETKEITKKVTVNKQSSTTSNLTLSGESGTITYPNEGTFTITNNASGGTLSVSSSDTSVATASLNGQTVTIIPGAITESGKTATITVKAQATSNYEEQTATYTVTVNQGEITISATEYSGNVDGQSHDAVTDVSVVPTDATVTYSLNDGEYSTVVPKVSAAGTYNVKIKAVREGYVEKEMEKTAVITKALPAEGEEPPEAGWTIEEAKGLVARDGLQSHLGEKVQYSPTGGGTWRIFYYDIENDGNDNGYFGKLYTLYLKRDYDSNYKIALSSYTTHIPSDNGVLMKKMNPKWGASSNSDEIDKSGEHAAAWLCDSNVWNTNYKIDGITDYAIGAPSVEMYMKAFNVYKDNNPNSTTLINKIGNTYGYSVGAKGSYTWNSSTSDYTGKDSIEAGPNNIFMNPGSGSICMSSPSMLSNGPILYITGSSKFIGGVGLSSQLAMCPVVALTEPVEAQNAIKQTAPDGEWWIPKGFVEAEESGKTIKEGKVIKDQVGNEWVWIPCYLNDKGKKIGQEIYKEATEYKRTDFGVYDGTSYSFSDYSEALDELDSYSIKKYGGFYIGRYEACADEIGVALDLKRKVLIQKNKYPYNYIADANCVKKSNGFATANNYDVNKVYTKLVSSYAWDTALCFIQKTVPDYATYSPQGNYGINDQIEYHKTGSSTPVCNIYDMGGNLYEYTSETSPTTTYPCVGRGGGGYSTSTASNEPAGYRKYVGGADHDSQTFRLTMYIKR